MVARRAKVDAPEDAKLVEKYYGIRVPTKATLRKYGLTKKDWKWLVADTQGRCPICMVKPSSGRLVIDHFHAIGWKKLPPEERRKHVRGVLCWVCNHSFLRRGMNLERAIRLVGYLRRARWV